MELSIVIPAYNEEENLPSLVEDIDRLGKREGWDYEIIVVDDNSSDSTLKIVKGYAGKIKGLRVIHLSERAGMGGALKEGSSGSRGEFIFWVMADKADDLNTIPQILNKLKEGYDMVFASRYMKGGSRGDLSPLKAFLSSCYTTITRLVFGITVHDITNAFRGFRKSIFNQLKLSSNDFAISPEFAIKAHLEGFKSGEVPTAYSNRKLGQTKFKMIRMMVRYLELLGLQRLLYILALSLILRAGYSFYLSERLTFPDEIRYDRIAQELITGRGFVSSSTSPGYPVFLASIYGFYGRSFLTVRVVQALLGTGLILLIYLIGKNLFNQKVGLLAAFLSALDPVAIFFTGLLLSETLYSFILLAAVYFWLKLSRDARTTLKSGFFWIASILWGMAILIKPISLQLLIFCALVKIIASRFHKKTIMSTLGICLLSLAIQTPWVLHNYSLCGKFILTTTGGGITLYESNNPKADGGPGYEKIVWTEEMKKMNEVEIDRYFKHEALEFIRKNPGRFLELAGKKFLRFWSVVPNAKDFQRPIYFWTSLIFYTPVFILGCVGIIQGIKRWRELALLYCVIIFFTLTHMVFLGSVRYRMPVMPFMLLFTASVFHPHPLPLRERAGVREG